MKKIVVILGHPDSESFNQALFDQYVQHLDSTKTQCETIEIRQLQFDPNLKYGYRKRMELEPDLLEAQRKLKWADHLVFIFPLWWGSVPAIMKGFFDRVLLPGYAFKKREDSVWWDKYFKGKSARMIVSMDQPAWYFRWVYHRPVYHALKQMTLQFIGVKKVQYQTVGIVRNSTKQQRDSWLQAVKRSAEKDSR